MLGLRTLNVKCKLGNRLYSSVGICLGLFEFLFRQSLTHHVRSLFEVELTLVNSISKGPAEQFELSFF